MGVGQQSPEGLALSRIQPGAAIGTLDARYQKPLQMHYCWPGRSDRSKAAACTCCLNTYKLRLDRAHRLFIQGWYGRQFVRSRVGLDTVDTFQ